jgi:hypothetical protein
MALKIVEAVRESSQQFISGFSLRVNLAGFLAHYAEEIGVNGLVGGYDGAFPATQGLAPNVGHYPTGFGHQQGAAGKLPGI